MSDIKITLEVTGGRRKSLTVILPRILPNKSHIPDFTINCEIIINGKSVGITLSTHRSIPSFIPEAQTCDFEKRQKHAPNEKIIKIRLPIRDFIFSISSHSLYGIKLYALSYRYMSEVSK